jgi:NAD+ kinase
MKIGIFIRKITESIVMTAIDSVRWLQDRGVSVSAPEDVAIHLGINADPDFPKGCDLVLSLGGDGTLLRAIHKTAPYAIPVLGINLGHLGYLTEVEGSWLRNSLIRVISNQYDLERRFMIRGTLMREGKELLTIDAVNDIYLYRNILSQVVDVEAYVGEEKVSTTRADGLIVFTPTGSTAYALSAGGPIIDPECEVIGMISICPHRIDQRPIIIPNSKPLRLVFDMSYGPASIFADGDIISQLRPQDELIVTRSPYNAVFAKFGQKEFYRVLQIKFNWGKR